MDFIIFSLSRSQAAVAVRQDYIACFIRLYNKSDKDTTHIHTATSYFSSIDL